VGNGHPGVEILVLVVDPRAYNCDFHILLWGWPEAGVAAVVLDVGGRWSFDQSTGRVPARSHVKNIQHRVAWTVLGIEVQLGNLVTLDMLQRIEVTPQPLNGGERSSF